MTFTSDVPNNNKHIISGAARALDSTVNAGQYYICNAAPFRTLTVTFHTKKHKKIEPLSSMDVVKGD
jgi:hypothetical protein